MANRLLRRSQDIFSHQQTHILSAAAVITAATFLSALLGLIKTRLLLSHFSATPALRAILDSYWVALRLPELIFQLLVIGALSAAFIPVFSKYWQKDPPEAYRISSSVMNIILLLFLILSVVIFVFARSFNDLLTSVQFTPSQLNLATNLTRIMIFAQLFFAVSNFLTGTIQAQQRFLIPALSPVAYNLGIIAGIIFLTPLIGIYGAAIGVLLGSFLHLLVQLPLAFKLGFTYYPVINYRHPGVKDMFRLMPPRTLAISVSQLELSAMVYFATALSAGNLTILQIAQQLMVAPIRLFSVPISQASLPFLAKETAQDNLLKFQHTFIHSLRQILYFAFPATMLLIVLRIPLVRIVYGTKQFPWATTLLTGKTLAILSLSLFAQSAIHLLVRAFYALHNTKSPFVIALTTVVGNIVLAYLMVFRWHIGILGLALSLSVTSIIQTLLLAISLHRHIPHLFDREFLFAITKMIFASLFMGIFLWAPMRLLDRFVFDTTRVINLILLTTSAGVTGLVVYLGLSRLFKLEELSAIWSLVHRIGNWHQVFQQTEEVLEPASQAQEIKPS